MRIIIILCFGMLLVGCGTGFCFRVDGEYEGKKGGFEYCYDPAKGILENAKNAQKAVIVTKEQLEEIKKEAEEISAKSKKKLIDKLIERVK